jgi:hypothetical protein
MSKDPSLTEAVARLTAQVQELTEAYVRDFRGYCVGDYVELSGGRSGNIVAVQGDHCLVRVRGEALATRVKYFEIREPIEYDTQD